VVMDPATEKTLIAVAGVTHFGTQSVGDFIANHRLLRATFAHAPSDWPRKNLRLVRRRAGSPARRDRCKWWREIAGRAEIGGYSPTGIAERI
jgi:hypothetical protein